MVDLSGKTLGKYRIDKRLGQGGMGEVYLGYHTRLDRYVAIKVLHGSLVEGEDFLRRFEREAKAMAALKHSNIIQVYDFDAEGDLYYLVEAYADGGSLKTRLSQAGRERRFLPWSEVVDTVEQVGAALDYAHGVGMLHRDVKPSNVLLDSTGKIFLADFGLVRLLDGLRLTTTGTLVGTPAYMSPEQGQGLALTPASDLYALGVILYEMVTNQVPFDAETPLAIIHKHIHAPLPSPRLHRAELPDALEELLQKALAKEPGGRPQKAAELAAALKEIPVFEWEAAQTFVHPPTKAQATAVTDVHEAATKMMEEAVTPPAAPAPPIPPATAAPQVESAVAERKTAVTELETPKPASTILVEAHAAPGEAPQAASPKATNQIEAALESAPEQPPEITPTVEIEVEPPPSTEAVKQPARAQTPPREAPARPKAVKPTGRKIRPLTLALGALALALIVFLGVWASGLLGGASCTTIDACMFQADELAAQGDLMGAIARIDAAIAMVPQEEQPMHAPKVCRRGDLYTMAQQPEQAIASYEQCIGWTHGDPGLEPLRVMATQNIDRLRGAPQP